MTLSGSPVAGVDHVALMSGDIDRLAQFYESVFGARVLARSEGTLRKCFIKVAPDTNLHVFQVGPDLARQPGDEPFDCGSINHFALRAADPGAFIAVRDRLVAVGRSDGVVYDAPGTYTIFATDPDGLFLEWLLPKTTGWEPPFETSPFVGLGDSAPRAG
jgi:catechol 2,3-dioxygenase-like lactoylglutathione lyase family enzyme